MESWWENQSAAVFVAAAKEPTYISLMSNVSAVLSNDDGEGKES